MNLSTLSVLKIPKEIYLLVYESAVSI